MPVWVLKCLEHTHMPQIAWLIFLRCCCVAGRWIRRSNCCSPQPKWDYMCKGVLNSTCLCAVVCIQWNAHVFIPFSCKPSNLTSSLKRKWAIGRVRACVFDQTLLKKATIELVKNTILHYTQTHSHRSMKPHLIITMIMCYCFQLNSFLFSFAAMPNFICAHV